MAKNRKIVVLLHENTSRYRLRRYMVHYLAQIWQQDGHTVEFVFGTKTYVPADICIVHVDLSVVPEKYIDYANRYPLALNGKIRDIRKSVISQNLVNRDSLYQGPVLVKSDLNYAGWPEKVYAYGAIPNLAEKVARKFGFKTNEFSTQYDYKYYHNIDAVPDEVFNNRDLVVEKYFEEMCEDLYCVNFLKFFGDAYQCVKVFSHQRVVTDACEVKREDIEPHPQIIDIRNEIGIDFGKLDYCVVDNQVKLIDVNKTSGVTRRNHTAAYLMIIRERANGLYMYF